MTMTPGLRKFALTSHVTSSVGWLGAVGAFLALAIAGLVSQDAQIVRAAYLAIRLDGRDRSDLFSASLAEVEAVLASMDEPDDKPIKRSARGSGRRLRGAVAHYLGTAIVSGQIAPGEKLTGEIANAEALDVSLGDGHVILIGFRPQWRGQPFGTFRVLFNALLAAPATSSTK